MTTGKVFEEGQEAPQGDNPQELTYLGKKYANEAELDKAYGHLNVHAGKLEEENRTLREQLEAKATQEDAVSKVLEALKGKTPEVQPEVQDPSKGTNSVDKTELEKMLRDLLSQEKQQTQEEKNFAAVRDSLTSQYGEKAAEFYKRRGEELGVDLDKLSAQSPQAVLELLNLKRGQQQTHGNFGPSSINTTNLNGPGEGTKAYWDAQYKAGNITREQKFRKEHEYLQKLGADKFFGRN